MAGPPPPLLRCGLCRGWSAQRRRAIILGPFHLTVGRYETQSLSSTVGYDKITKPLRSELEKGSVPEPVRAGEGPGGFRVFTLAESGIVRHEPGICGGKPKRPPSHSRLLILSIAPPPSHSLLVSSSSSPLSSIRTTRSAACTECCPSFPSLAQPPTPRADAVCTSAAPASRPFDRHLTRARCLEPRFPVLERTLEYHTSPPHRSRCWGNGRSTAITGQLVQLECGGD